MYGAEDKACSGETVDGENDEEALDDEVVADCSGAEWRLGVEDEVRNDVVDGRIRSRDR